MSDVQERAAVLALVARTEREWHRTAAVIEEVGSAVRVLNKDWTGFETFDTGAVGRLAETVTAEDIVRYTDLIEEYASKDVTLITVLDTAYPTNLRQVYNRPPFLFVRGSLGSDDDRSIAVVGTRRASEHGIQIAGSLASQLVEHRVTVLSGLAAGIDAAAHAAAIAAGGKTVAVMGTGIDTIYPKENAPLADEILSQGGALVSQFWPDAPPTKFSFPMRNVVMSGMAIGTAVIEASSTSGAKMQARLALEHGKRLFLLKSLVDQEEWARSYSERSGAVVVSSVDEIISAVAEAINPPKQLAFS